MRIQQVLGILWAFIVVLTPIYLVRSGSFWHHYSRVYVFAAVFFVWMSLGILFIVDIRKRKNYMTFSDMTRDVYVKHVPYSVIVPVYNEDEEMFDACIQSIKRSYGEKDIIVIDDGSTQQDTKDYLGKLEQDPDVFVVRCPTNRGKKFVQVEAVSLAKNEYVISVDSDTLFDQDALLRLAVPLLRQKIGMTNCDVLITNADDSFVTKMHKLQNHGAFRVGRRSLGGFGIMNCASGIGVGFKKSVFQKLQKEYVDKRPFGFDCKFGEDRFLTNLFLREGYDIVFVEDAKAHTYIPNKVKKYLMQQLRWKISGVIEGIHVLTFAWKRRKLLWFYSVFNLLLPYFCITVILTILLSSILRSDPLLFISFIFIIITATFVRDTVLVVEDKKLLKYIIPYSMWNLFVLIWLWIFALFRIDEKSWLTR